MCDIIKKFRFREPKLSAIFIDNIRYKLQAAEWRANTYTSWNLEQQKR